MKESKDPRSSVSSSSHVTVDKIVYLSFGFYNSKMRIIKTYILSACHSLYYALASQT